MSNSGILCPYCRSGVLGYRRKNGTISVKTSMTIESGAIYLVCPDCGKQTHMMKCAPVLVPTT